MRDRYTLISQANLGKNFSVGKFLTKAKKIILSIFSIVTGIEEQFNGKKLLVKKLVPFGFTKEGPNYALVREILGGQFRLEIRVGRGKKVSVKVFDNDSGEEYLLFSVLSVQGTLVGRIRKEVSVITDKFIGECFKTQIF